MEKEEILRYTYYDEAGKYIAIIDKDKLKEIFKVDEVRFEE